MRDGAKRRSPTRQGGGRGGGPVGAKAEAEAAMRDSGAEGGPAPEGGHDDGGGVWPVDAQARMPAACSTEEEEDGGFGGGRGGGGRELRRRRPCGSGGPRAEATPARAGLAERVGALLGGKGGDGGSSGEWWRKVERPESAGLWW